MSGKRTLLYVVKSKIKALGEKLDVQVATVNAQFTLTKKRILKNL